MIKKITIEVAGKEIELSMEDALKLYHDLNKLFPEPFTPSLPVPYYPHLWAEPYRRWERPVTKTTGNITTTDHQIYT